MPVFCLIILFIKFESWQNSDLIHKISEKEQMIGI